MLNKYRLSIFLLGTIILHHIFILMRDTSAMHGMVLPSIEIWTFVLFIPLAILSAYLLSKPAKELNLQFLYIAVILSLSSTILRSFNFSTYFMSYGLLLVMISLFTIMALYKQRKIIFQIYVLTSIIALIILFITSFYINFPNIAITLLGIFFEVALLTSIIIYNTHLKLKNKQLIIIFISSIIGLIIGYMIIYLDNNDINSVPALILRTVFEQTLGISQFSFTLFNFIEFKTEYFFIIHFIEIFNVGAILLVKKRSIPAISLILTGFDLSYPPLSWMRALAVLLYLKSKEIAN